MSKQSNIYFGLGNIYFEFKEMDIAKSHYNKGLNLSEDSLLIGYFFNNLALIEIQKGNIDSAFYYLNHSLQINKQYNNDFSEVVLSSIAEAYQQTKLYDSAFYYFRLSLIESRINDKNQCEAEILSRLGSLFFEVNKIDSVLYYIDLSNNIAKENKQLRVLADNYLTLSKVEESKGHTKQALEYFKIYSNLKDSLFSVDKFSEINQLQRLYEVSKSNEIIEQLVIEQQVNERTIYYKNIIWRITTGVLILVCIVLFIITLQIIRLKKSHKKLVEKNDEIIKFYENAPAIVPETFSETIPKTLLEDTEDLSIEAREDIPENNADDNSEKNKRSALSEKDQKELITRIQSVMENTEIVCNIDFSIEKLAKLVHSNQRYVSEAINSLKKNFNKFLNAYRIREAQRLFSIPEAKNYTVEYVANQVGFKSRASFINAFKESTGISPGFYLKSMIDEKSKALRQ
jgi:AraC-like DNA-binding protein